MNTFDGMFNTPQVNLIAVMGAGGNIGPAFGPLVFAEIRAAEDWAEWFNTIIEGGYLVVGTTTYRMMVSMGYREGQTHAKVALWTRQIGVTPDEFITEMKKEGLPIFIVGGRRTFEVFMPYVDQFFIRRAEVKSAHFHTMPPLFKPAGALI